MQLSEIRQKVRSLLDDEIGSDSAKYWKDADLTENINSCVEEFAERTLCITDSLSSACLIALVVGTRHYDLDDSILAIQTVQPSWCDTPLGQTTRITAPSGWLSAVGPPVSYLLDYSSKKLSLTSAPATVAGETLRLTANRLPASELADDTDVPEIPRQYHRKLYDGVMALAYLKQDAETYNPAKSKAHMEKWGETMMTAVRREAMLKPRIIVANRLEMC